MAASKAVQTIQTGEVMYQSQYGHFVATRAWSSRCWRLQRRRSRSISGTLAGGTLGGYKFALVGTADTYAVGAAPITYGSSGVKSFFLDQTGILRASEGPQPATSSSPEFAK